MQIIKKWDFLTSLNQEYIQHHWPWFSKELESIFVQYPGPKLVDIEAYVYSTIEEDQKKIKTSMRNYIFTERQNSDTDHQKKKVIFREKTDLYTALIGLFHTVNIHLGLINLYFNKYIVKETITLATATVHPNFIFQAMLHSAKFMICNNPQCSESTCHYHLQHQETFLNLHQHRSQTNTLSIITKSPPQCHHPYQTSSQDESSNESSPNECCFNQVTYNVLKNNMDFQKFNSNKQLYLKTLNPILIHDDLVPNYYFFYYKVPNFVIFDKLIETIIDLKMNFIIVKGWFKHYLFLMKPIPKDYPFQTIFQYKCKHSITWCCEEAIELLNKENLTISMCLPQPFTVYILKKGLEFTKQPHNFDKFIEKLQSVILHNN